MEKVYTCVGCSKNFKVLRTLDKPVYTQHEVEMGVECPYCSKTNAIVWRQDESLPLVVTVEKPGVNSDIGNFYIQAQCCTSCGVPQAVAPGLVGWTDENLSQCYLDETTPDAGRGRPSRQNYSFTGAWPSQIFGQRPGDTPKTPS